MIPRSYITAWRSEAPWIDDFQVEQDLVISRALVELFRHPVIAGALAFRGGTALYKLHARPAARYSEDIDLVQIAGGAAGPLMTAIRDALEPWLGKAAYVQKNANLTFSFRFASEDTPPVPLRLKVEINTREHDAVYGLVPHRFEIDSPWFAGAADIRSYQLDELMGTKLRALYQRKKGRDLFDLALALRRPDVDPDRIVTAFQHYLHLGGHAISRREFERNLADKRADKRFTADMGPLLAPGHTWDFARDLELVESALIARLDG